MTKRVQKLNQDSEFSRGKFKVTHSLHKTHLINNVDEDMRNGKKQKSSLYKAKVKDINFCFIWILAYQKLDYIQKPLLVIMITQESHRQNYNDEKIMKTDRTEYTGMRSWQALVTAEALGAMGIPISSGS